MKMEIEDSLIKMEIESSLMRIGMQDNPMEMERKGDLIQIL